MLENAACPCTMYGHNASQVSTKKKDLVIFFCLIIKQKAGWLVIYSYCVLFTQIVTPVYVFSISQRDSESVVCDNGQHFYIRESVDSLYRDDTGEISRDPRTKRLKSR